MAPIESTQAKLGSELPDFNLIGTGGGMNAPRDFADYKVLVVAFICNHCPYAKAAIPRLIKLQEEYLEKSVMFVGINANDPKEYPEDDMEHMTKYAQEWGMNFPYLVDDTQEVAKAFGAVCTPDIFVYDRDRKLAYHGRIDDNWQDEEQVSTYDLKEALEALIIGADVNPEQHPSMGCSIKWKQ
ncbi:MAG: thioredoxin family protein [Candidatus Nomurabacteria bacterium]|nr:MAG: thioredoxin family protein [Candidatus Nomurabacteria bacterium]